MTGRFIAGMVVAAALGAAAFMLRLSYSRQRAETAEWDKRNVRLKNEIESARSDLKTLQQEKTLAERDLLRVEALRDDIEGLNQSRNARIQAWIDRVRKLRDTLTARPELGIPELHLLSDETWFRVAQNPSMDEGEGLRVALASLRTHAKMEYARRMMSAMQDYKKEHGGALPDSPELLGPYLQSPLEREALSRYVRVTADPSSPAASMQWLFREKTPIDPDFDDRAQISGGGATGSMHAPGAWIEGFEKATVDAVRAYRLQNPGNSAWTFSDILPYLALDPASLEKLRASERMRSRKGR